MLERPRRLRFSGALDAETVHEALSEIDAVVETEPTRVVVDLGDLERLDSAGVHALVTLYKRVTRTGGTVVVVNAKAQPLMVLELLKLTKTFGM